MPLFQINKDILNQAKSVNFNLEKDIQRLIEQNIETVFNCRFVASEFSTGSEHAGRIDTLCLSEDNNPVIIEYKKVESSELVNQSLYYLSWIKDHKGDFQIAANRALGQETEIDWSDIRVICIAPGYKKFDLHAVQMMGANIELWQYRLYDNNCLYLEEVFRRSTVLSTISAIERGKNPVMVEAGRKAALTRQTGQYTVEQHTESTDEAIRNMFIDLREFILGLDESIEESPRKHFIAYKVAQNFVCVEIRKNKILLFLKLDPKRIKFPKNARDVSEIGHYGTGNLELSVTDREEIEIAKELIKNSFDSIAG